jgi:hypothetical protein
MGIKAFCGTSKNAVKAQIWIALSVYARVAIARKQLKLEASLCQTLLILGLTLFENFTESVNQLILLEGNRTQSTDIPLVRRQLAPRCSNPCNRW